MADDVKIPYGIHRPTGRTVHVSDVSVPSGEGCNCICANCKGVLIAKKGQENAHHFAHKAVACDHRTALETSLHIGAKQIIMDAGGVSVPGFLVWLDPKNQRTVKEGWVAFDSVRSEVRNEIGNKVPDIIGTSRGKTYVIEIFVTHKTVQEKIAILVASGAYAIEIDLSKCLQKQDDLIESVLHSAKREWLANPDRDALLREMQIEVCRKRMAAFAVELCRDDMSGNRSRITERLHLFNNEMGSLLSDERINDLLGWAIRVVEQDRQKEKSRLDQIAEEVRQGRFTSTEEIFAFTTRYHNVPWEEYKWATIKGFDEPVGVIIARGGDEYNDLKRKLEHLHNWLRSSHHFAEYDQIDLVGLPLGAILKDRTARRRASEQQAAEDAQKVNEARLRRQKEDEDRYAAEKAAEQKRLAEEAKEWEAKRVEEKIALRGFRKRQTEYFFRLLKRHYYYHAEWDDFLTVQLEFRSVQEIIDNGGSEFDLMIERMNKLLGWVGPEEWRPTAIMPTNAPRLCGFEVNS